MTGRRAVVVLGAVSLAGSLFAFARDRSGFAHGEFVVVDMRGSGIVVAVVLGLLAVVAGLLGSRVLTLVAGLAFLAAAGILLAQLAERDKLIDGNGSTFSLWLGLGAGLVAVAAARPRRE